MSETEYLIYSTVLGKLLTEIKSDGTKKRTFVYGMGGVVALQTYNASSQAEVRWEHTDPGGASYIQTGYSGQMSNDSKAELDPLGSNVGTYNPYVNQSTASIAVGGWGYGSWVIKKIYFCDESTGYIVDSENSIFRTSDGGKSWEKVYTLLNYSVNDLFFINSNEGFIVANQTSISELDTKSESHIMKTKDGGHSWVIAYSSDSVFLKKLNFNSPGLGVAVGRRTISNPRDNSLNFVLVTDDNGETWNDVSEYLNQLAVNTMGGIKETLTDAIYSKENGIVVLSSRGTLYNTSDNGKSWYLFSRLYNEPSQTDIRRLYELNNKYAITGSTISMEGKWSIIALFDVNNSSWERYRLNDYYFADIEFLSNTEIIAVGSLIAPNNFSVDRNLSKGIILYSLDSGKNWTIIHKSNTSSVFSSISKLTNQRFFIGGDNGIGLIVEKN